MDVLLATGEQVTIALLAMALSDRGHPGKSYLADQVAIRTDSSFGRARISAIDTEQAAGRHRQRHRARDRGFSGRG